MKVEVKMHLVSWTPWWIGYSNTLVAKNFIMYAAGDLFYLHNLGFEPVRQLQFFSTKLMENKI